MFKKLAAAAALALMASSSFAAAPTGFYIGGDVGGTKIDDFDSTKKAIGAFAGYGINQNVAVELGYRQHGDFEYYGTEVKAKQTHLSVIGSFPLNNQLDVYGRLGASYLKVEADYRGYKSDDSDTKVLYGIGLNMSFTPNIFGRVEVQKMSSDSTTLNVGVGYKF
ncbi:putative outer membrane protein [Pseudoduganella flava]|uniref:Outer membrane beta-barrel protein n=1 Tax=Pseudoduganella flava TaxID=871742 RepID=A0A562PVL3_9BURK|nr:porin family protein [Pseudoduganella flava]QGZ39563.1 outer membrane beta-barrel protein [Pseudoduganella flava]TWI48459.1 putative outer membrane protein [Pseudoduganella flava]